MVLTIAALMTGQQAWAEKAVQSTIPVRVIINGAYQTKGKTGIYVIGSDIGNSYPSGYVEGQNQILPTDPYNIGSQDFPLSMTVTGGYIQLATSTSNTDVTVNSTNFTLTFTSSSKYIIAASVTKNDGTEVAGCTVTGAYSKSVSVHIPEGAVFGRIDLTMTLHAPLEVCTLSGIASSYVDDGVNQPEPTIILEGQTLTKDVHYTASYGVSVENGIGHGTVTVTGIGEYTGSKSQNYNIRLATLSDFTQLGDGAYEIATPQDMINLARFVNTYQTENRCDGVTFRQTADISFSYTKNWNSAIEDNNFISIGCFGRSFRGTYDGGGHIVRGIRIYKKAYENSSTSQGLIGFLGTGGTVKNVILIDAAIIGYTNIGGIVGYLDEGGSVMDCYAFNTLAGHLNTQSGRFGIIAGYKGGTITRAHYRDCETYSKDRPIDNMHRSENNIYSVTVGNGVVLSSRTGGTVLGTSGITLYDDGASINGTEYYNKDAIVTVSPASGYQFTNVSVSNHETAKDNGDGTWRFKMPTADVTVSATLAIAVAANPHDGYYWTSFYSGTQSYRTDATVYTAEVSGDKVNLTEVTDGIIPAGQAVILKANSTPITLTLTQDAATGDYTVNQLLGVDEETTQDANKTYYVLSKKDPNGLGFYKLSSSKKLGAHKAYLEVSTSSPAPEYFGFDDSDSEDGIIDIEHGTLNIEHSAGAVYDLSGRKVNPQSKKKGIYIVNGRKVLY